jgi:hypothetical protein
VGRGRGKTSPSDTAGGAIDNPGLVACDETLTDKGLSVMWGNSLTVGEEDGIGSYTSSDYRDINGVLRYGPDAWGGMTSQSLWKADTDRLLGRVQQIDSALAKAPAHPEMWVARYVGAVGNKKWDKSEGIPHEGAFVDKGYVSTTRNGRVGVGRENRVMVRVPAGRIGVYIKARSSLSSENEFLLPRGLTYQVKHFSDGTEYWEVVGK